MRSKSSKNKYLPHFTLILQGRADKTFENPMEVLGALGLPVLGLGKPEQGTSVPTRDQLTNLFFCRDIFWLDVLMVSFLICFLRFFFRWILFLGFFDAPALPGPWTARAGE